MARNFKRDSRGRFAGSKVSGASRLRSIKRAGAKKKARSSLDRAASFASALATTAKVGASVAVAGVAIHDARNSVRSNGLTGSSSSLAGVGATMGALRGDIDYARRVIQGS